MLTHEQRIEAARGVVDYVCGRTSEEMERPVPNCPGWTVYHAASHIGRVSIAWEAMILATPDDPESRNRGYADAARRPEGAGPDDLAAWAHSAIDKVVDDIDAPSYFSMTGGHGTHGLWAWHAASELGVHRLDVESALGHDHAASDAQAVDALTYACHYFLPAMRRVTGEDPGGLVVRPRAADGSSLGDIGIPAQAPAPNQPSIRPPTRAPAQALIPTVVGRPIDLLLAVWGRPHGRLETLDNGGGVDAGGGGVDGGGGGVDGGGGGGGGVDGGGGCEVDVLAGWRALPGKAFQFGAWD